MDSLEETWTRLSNDKLAQQIQDHNNERERDSPRKSCTEYQLSADNNDTAGTDVMDGDTCDIPSLMEMTQRMEDHYSSDDDETTTKVTNGQFVGRMFAFHRADNESLLQEQIDNTAGELQSVWTKQSELGCVEKELREKLELLTIKQHDPDFVRLRLRIWLGLCAPLLAFEVLTRLAGR
jgi:hypothetical protein